MGEIDHAKHSDVQLYRSLLVIFDGGLRISTQEKKKGGEKGGGELVWSICV